MYPEVDRRLSAWVWEMYAREINVTDEILQEKAKEIINTYKKVCVRTATVDLKLSRGWSWRFKNQIGSNLTKATARVQL